MGSSYEKLGSASDVKNVNPFTNDLYNQLLNQSNQFGKMFQSSKETYSPEAAFNYYFNTFTPQVMDVMNPATSQMAKSQTDLAAMLSQKGIQDTMGAFANNDLMYSGAAAKAVSNAAQLPYMTAANNITTQQTQLMNNLLGTGMSIVPQSFQGQQELYGNMLLGTNQQLSQLAQPEWWQPTYAQKKGLWDYAMDVGTLGVGAVAAGMNPASWLTGMFSRQNTSIPSFDASLSQKSNGWLNYLG